MEKFKCTLNKFFMEKKIRTTGMRLAERLFQNIELKFGVHMSSSQKLKLNKRYLNSVNSVRVNRVNSSEVS